MSDDEVAAKVAAKVVAVIGRVGGFYAHLNAREFRRCYDMIDPAVRLLRADGIEFGPYEASLLAMCEALAPVRLTDLRFSGVQRGLPRNQERRELAAGNGVLVDRNGRRHVVRELWVCDNLVWYTRATGFVVPHSET